MRVTWDPKNGEPVQTWDFDPEDVMASAAMRIEKEYGGSFDSWINGVRTRESKARKVLLWHLLCENAPRLQYKDVPDFRMRQLLVELGVAELTEMLEKISKMKMDEGTREGVMAAIEVDLKEAREREFGVFEGELLAENGQAVENLPKPV